MEIIRKIKLIIAVLTFFTIPMATFAQTFQVPQKMSYQSVVRNANNQIVANQNIGIKISIIEGSLTGTTVYSETHQALTNANGLFSLETGGGTPVTGTFLGINWGSGSHYIKSEIDVTGGPNYNLSGTMELLSVPYALYAANTGSTIAGPQGPQGLQGPQGIPGSAISSTYTIGLWSELGGYVFRISSDGKHGLISETIDQGTAEATYAQDLVSNPLTHSINGAKYMDWRLPTKYEAYEMYVQRLSIGNFQNLWYWTSVNVGGSSNYFWLQQFGDVIIGNANNQKYGDYQTTPSVRAIRSF